MKIIKHPVFILLIILASVVYFAKLFDLYLPNFISFYLNDLLCMPIILSICLAAIRKLKKDNTLYVPIRVIIVVTLYYIFHFEWLLPKFHPRYTADFIDIGFYIIGAFLFYRFQKYLF